MKVSYKDRLNTVEKLGHLFPGFTTLIGYRQKSLGLFGGIYLQTKWQMDSGRDKLPIWYLVNEQLTLAPYRYALEFIKNPNQPGRKSQSDTRGAWMEYFRASTSASPRTKLCAMWKGHTTAIRYSLWKYKNELESVEIEPAELAFWKSWVKIILSLEKLAPPTNDLFLKLPLQMTMPKRTLSKTYKPDIFKQLFLRAANA